MNLLGCMVSRVDLYVVTCWSVCCHLLSSVLSPVICVLVSYVITEMVKWSVTYVFVHC